MINDSRSIHASTNRSLARSRLNSVVLSLFVLLYGALALGDPVQELREMYLDPQGAPSSMVYERVHGIAAIPGSQETELEAVFKLTYRKADLDRLPSAEAIAADCYLVRTKRFSAPYRALPVWDGRVYLNENTLLVGAYSHQCEHVVGHCDNTGVHLNRRRSGSAFPLLELEGLQYNPFTGELWRPGPGGAIEEKQSFFLPIPLIDAQGLAVQADFEVVSQGAGQFELVAHFASRSATLARCKIDAEHILQQSAGYSPELGAGCTMATEEPTVVLQVRGKLSDKISPHTGPWLFFDEDVASVAPRQPHIQIDGHFDDWRSVRGVGDPHGDIPGYLQYNPDVDLLEFKVTNDGEHLYFYSRVVGKHGNTAPGRDRYYFYVYMDVDQNAGTGYIPTRDDDCYFGVAIGDDCESQFEFVGGRFMKTFFGFTGAGTEKEVLEGKVTLAPSHYSRHDSQGKVRDRYKVEYIRQGGKQKITKDFAQGTSDEIVIAISPDGSECEMRTALDGFLHNEQGEPIVAVGQRIDLALGVEASGEIHGNTKWGADSTSPIRGYEISSKTPPTK